LYCNAQLLKKQFPNRRANDQLLFHDGEYVG